MLGAWSLAGSSLAVVTGGLGLAGPAVAASCAATMRIQGGLTSPMTLNPAQTSIAPGACVTFTNDTGQPGESVHVTVEGGFAKDVPPGGAADYPAGTTGKHAVHVTGSLAGSASGVITVQAGPSPTRSPAQSSAPSGAPSHQPSPAPSTSSSGSGPQVAPTPSPPLVGGLPPAHNRPTPPASAPAVAPVPTTVGPTAPVTPSASPAAVVSGPIEPGNDRGVGLPAALAALAIVGAGTGLARVLYAEPAGPVDTGGNVATGR